MYKETYERQNLPVENIQTIRNLLDNLSLSNKLRLFASKTKEGDVGSMAAFATDRKRAYYVFGANSSHMGVRTQAPWFFGMDLSYYGCLVLAKLI